MDSKSANISIDKIYDGSHSSRDISSIIEYIYNTKDTSVICKILDTEETRSDAIYILAECGDRAKDVTYKIGKLLPVLEGIDRYFALSILQNCADFGGFVPGRIEIFDADDSEIIKKIEFLKSKR